MTTNSSIHLEAQGNDDGFPGPRIASLYRIMDAAVAIALTTAILYFWGYIYYREFCERFGVRFHGISIQVEEYLVAGWEYAILSPLILFAFLLLGHGLWFFIGLAIDKKSRNEIKKTAKNKNVANDASLIYIRSGLMLVYGFGVFFIGLGGMFGCADRDADRIKKDSQPVVIRDISGVKLEGSFIYLRDFGSVLLVAEKTSDANALVGIRVIKQNAYGSYTLLTKPDQSKAGATP